ncbi:MAG: hypothetical protein HKO95_04260 [Rhodobacteraceae bacterium]|nr:glycosyltransferase family 2 protein [Alphaproteobacteria bacterium]MBT8476282.1 glycosyltransferase family 2 protein [Alphaproteobacteria bacterium]NNK65930.1 hypothetical protein [Paracoccaceae bacterium]
MAKKPICALTHVRHEGFFLEKWIAHYGAIVGRENLFVVIDGDDWTPQLDLTGLTVEVVTDAPRARIRNDRWAAKALSARANQLRKSYDFVIRCDVDEYVAIDPASGLEWPTALTEASSEGYVYALGIDMIHVDRETRPLDRSQPVLGQRRHGYVSSSYTKPFVISRWNNWAGGGHRLINRPVRLSSHFILFHLALCDRALATERHIARGGDTLHKSFKQHVAAREEVMALASAQTPETYDTAEAIARRDFPVEGDGTPAKRPRPSPDPTAGDLGILTRIPDRFTTLL